MMTEEAALRIVKQAEQEYEQGNKDLVMVVARIANGWWYEDNHNLDPEYRRNDWQKFHEGMGAMESASSEEVAEMLSSKIKSVAELLQLVREKGL